MSIAKVSEISTHSAFRIFQHYSMGFLLVLSYILYFEFFLCISICLPSLFSFSPIPESPLRLSARHFSSLVFSTPSKKGTQRKYHVYCHIARREKSVKYNGSAISKRQYTVIHLKTKSRICYYLQTCGQYCCRSQDRETLLHIKFVYSHCDHMLSQSSHVYWINVS
jgi:hypothetical protein